jgi:hypothetical protein
MTKDRKKLLSIDEYEKLIVERWDIAKKGRPTGVACGACGGELVRPLMPQERKVGLVLHLLCQCQNRECGACAWLPQAPGA